MIIDITEDMRNMAAWGENHCEAMYKNSRGSYTNLHADFRWYYGFLGELVFLRYLQAHNVQHRYEHEYKGGDNNDFVVWPIGYTDNGGMCNVDVKTASKPSHKYLMLPDAQLERYSTEVFVGVRILNTNQGEVCGYALRKDLKPITDLGLPVPTSGVLFTELRPITGMIEKCKKIMG